MLWRLSRKQVTHKDTLGNKETTRGQSAITLQPLKATALLILNISNLRFKLSIVFALPTYLLTLFHSLIHSLHYCKITSCYKYVINLIFVNSLTPNTYRPWSLWRPIYLDLVVHCHCGESIEEVCGQLSSPQCWHQLLGGGLGSQTHPGVRTHQTPDQRLVHQDHVLAQPPAVLGQQQLTEGHQL